MRSWLEMSWAVRVLRAFLGVTFLYAGVQKLLDPGFLTAGSPTYIGTQLNGFAVDTPAAPLMRLLAHAPVAVGVATALTEIAIGVAVLSGIGIVAAIIAGLVINLTLWLSATWHVHPYFVGSDSVYAVAWLVLLLAVVPDGRRRVSSTGGGTSRNVALTRRDLLRGGAVAGVTLAAALLADAFASPWTGRSSTASGFGRSGVSTAPSRDAPGTSRTPSPSVSAVTGRTIATIDRLPIGKAVGFSAPGVGPAAVVRLADGSVVAYSRVCTHAGCLVGYDPQAELLVCPCHGARFDPAHGADPLPGSPTSTPLQKIPVVVDRATGDVILPS